LDDGDDTEKKFENTLWSPLSDIYENKENYVVKMDLPGNKKEDIKILYVDNHLNISSEQKHERNF